MASSAPPGERDEEALAVRPIETAPRRTGIQAKKAASPSSTAWLALAGAGALATGAFFLGRGAAAPPTLTVRSEEAQGPAASLERDRGADPAQESSPKATRSAADAAGSRSPAPPASSVGGGASADPASERSPASERPGASAAGAAQLVLLGEGTTVRVDGLSRGTAPARVTVDPGSHVVVFSFAATGETRSQSITVRPGERSTLRADFTGAAPAIRVERTP
jgi:hypothetical protein